MTRRAVAAVVGVVGLVTFVGGWRCGSRRLADERASGVSTVASLEARLAEADRLHGAAIAEKQAEIDVARVETAGLVRKVEAARAAARRDIAEIRESEATWEQKFGALELKYSEDMATTSRALDAALAENKLLVEQVTNYRLAAEDYRKINNESLAEVRRLVSDNLRLGDQVRKFRTVSVVSSVGVAVLAVALSLRRG